MSQNNVKFVLNGKSAITKSDDEGVSASQNEPLSGNSFNPTSPPPNSPDHSAFKSDIETRRKSFPPRVMFSPDCMERPKETELFRPKLYRQNTPFKPSDFFTPRDGGDRKSSSPHLGVHAAPIKSPGISPINSGTDSESPSFEEFKNLFQGNRIELNRFVDESELLQLTGDSSALSQYDDSHSFLNKNVSIGDEENQGVSDAKKVKKQA